VATMRVTRSGPTGGMRPVDIVLSPDGRRAYVSHGQSGDVRVVDTESLAVTTVIPTGPRSWWMASTPDGRFLWVTVGRANEVAVIDTETNTVVRRVSAGTLPWGIAIADVP
jgi:YVTN family beta-propeller protein